MTIDRDRNPVETLPEVPDTEDTRLMRSGLHRAGVTDDIIEARLWEADYEIEGKRWRLWLEAPGPNGGVFESGGRFYATREAALGG